jgi:hypothetical protein
MATDISFSFSLSLDALDLIGEQLRLDNLPIIFEVPSVGATQADRVRLRERVMRDLTERNLAERGRLVPDAEDALLTLSRFGHAVDCVGQLANGDVLCSRVVTDGRTAVRAGKHDQHVRFEVFRPEHLVEAVLEQIGRRPAGPGHSVTFPESTEPIGADSGAAQWPDSDDDGFAGVFQPVRPRASGHQLQLRAAMTITEKRREQIGWFTVIGRDQRGHEHRQPQIVWFDTEDGRYLSYRSRGQDDQMWSTYTPADSGRIAHQLISTLNALNRPR